jgi:kumamolisin
MAFRPPRPSLGRPAALVLLAALTVAAGWVELPLARAVGPEAGGAAVPAVSSASEAVRFARDAGFDPALTAAVRGAAPAQGVRSVDVVFTHELASPDYQAVEQYFRAAGLSVTRSWSDRLLVSLAGPSGAIDRAFSTDLASGTYRGSSVVYPSSAPSLPGWLEGLVAGVVGLSAGWDTFTLPLVPSSSTPPASPAPGAAPGSNEVTPAIARQIYDVSNLFNVTGAEPFPVGVTIAPVLWGEGYAPSDLSTFFSADYPSSFPAPKIVPHPVDGAPMPSDSAVNSPDGTAVQELTLDLEWAGSMAPGANLEPAYAPDGPAPSYEPTTVGMTDALAEAMSLPNVSVITMSFGVPEAGDASLSASWNSMLSSASADGITLLAATGDTGGDVNASCTGGPAPEYPSTNPNVIAVGGTNVNFGSLGIYSGSFTESAWSNGGGGFSTQFGSPSWQEVGSANDPVPAGSTRGVPDVSATAATNFYYFNGSATSAGGTSFAAPLWAGIVATMDGKLGSALGFVLPRLYLVGRDEASGIVEDGLADITSGSNCVASATTGWDAASGWGSPRAAILYYDLEGTFVNISLSPTPTTVGPGGAVTVLARVTNWTTGAPLPDTNVSLALAADTSLGPCVGTFGSATLRTDANGEATTRFSVPYCYLGSHAIASAEVSTATIYGTGSRTVGVNLLGYVPGLAFLAHPPWSYVGYAVIMAAAVAVGGVLGRRRPRGHPAPPVASVTPSAAAPTAQPPVPAVESPAPAPAPVGPPEPAVPAAEEPPEGGVPPKTP